VPWRDAADADDLAPLILALYAEDPAQVPMTRAKIERTLARLRAEPVRGRALVLDDGDGYALLCSFWSNELGGEVCVIDELYVKPSARGRGAATALVQAILDGRWFAEAVAIELEVTPANARARALYERLGFRTYKNALMRRTTGSS
jgi:ribosomal protein S18 acetylase RimI-like enzyme